MSTDIRTFRPAEERVCSLNHFWGGVVYLFLLFSGLAVGLTLQRPVQQVLGSSLFCVAFAATLLTSARYHAIPDLCLSRRVWQLLDHCVIYLMIASTHTSSMLVMRDIGYHPQVLVFVWVMALLGIGLKMPLLGKTTPRSEMLLDLIGVLLYLGLGWLGAVILYKSPLGISTLLHSSPAMLLLAGGASYTGGVFFYWRDREGDHNIFHWFVLAGGTLHFVAHFVAMIA